MNKSLLSGVVCLALLSFTAEGFPLQVKDGKIIYETDAQGNRTLDYSYCGYRNSSVPIPDINNVVVSVPWKAGDNTERIQRAIDYASSLPVGKDGFRGTVLLDKGVYEISGSLRISASGVVLRGRGEGVTTIKKNGVDRGALLYVEGVYDPVVTDTVTITSGYVPVNGRTFSVDRSGKLAAGERAFILRPSSKEWIESIGCDIFGGGISALGWKPGDVDMRWDRNISAVNGNEVTIDSPVSMALDSKWGISQLLTYTWKGRISDVGVEYLSLMSDYDRKYPKDEDHCWDGISVSNAENCWVRQVDFKHFAGSAVILQPTASRITVEDCVSTDPVSEI